MELVVIDVGQRQLGEHLGQLRRAVAGQLLGAQQPVAARSPECVRVDLPARHAVAGTGDRRQLAVEVDRRAVLSLAQRLRLRHGNVGVAAAAIRLRLVEQQDVLR